MNERPTFFAELGRGFALLGTLGVSVVLTGFLSGVGGWTDSTPLSVAAFVVSVLLSIAGYVLAFRLALARRLATRELIRGAVAAALVWQGMLAAGRLLLTRTVGHSQSLYGAFGLVLALLAWLHVLAGLTLFAAEWDVVRARRLWPRALLVPPTTDADREAFTAYAVTQRRLSPDDQQVRVTFVESADREPARGVTPGD